AAARGRGGRAPRRRARAGVPRPHRAPGGPPPATRCPRRGIEQRVQIGGLAPLKGLSRQGHRQIDQAAVPGRRPHRQVAAAQYIETVEELLATHELVARRDVALLDVELMGPARDGVLVVVAQDVLTLEEVPGAGAAAEGIDLVPGQVAPPATDRVSRGTTTAAAQQGKAHVLPLVQMPDPLQADDQDKDAAQQAALQGAPLVGEAVPGHGQPLQRRRHQQEGAGVLRACEEKGGAGVGTGWPWLTKGTEAAPSGRGGASGGAPAPPRPAAPAARLGNGAAARQVASCRPNFLRNLYRAMRETRTPKVRSTKSIRSARLAAG